MTKRLWTITAENAEGRKIQHSEVYAEKPTPEELAHRLLPEAMAVPGRDSRRDATKVQILKDQGFNNISITDADAPD